MYLDFIIYIQKHTNSNQQIILLVLTTFIFFLLIILDNILERKRSERI